MRKNKKGEWIAKNNITGNTYGKAFESIYDCQKYIDEELTFLQYEWKQLKQMEEYYKEEEDFQKWYRKRYKGIQTIVVECGARMQFAIESIMKTKTYKEATGTNVIRCYNIKQERWAEGLDF